MTAQTNVYVWRLRIPFITMTIPKLSHQGAALFEVYVNFNSLSIEGDFFVSAALDLWVRRAPFGTYNMTNPGFVTTRHVGCMV